MDANGLVTAVGVGGPVNITATTQDGAKIATSAITVQAGAVSVTAASISPSSTSININESKQLTASVLPITATNKTVVWSSDDATIVKVDANGLITGVKEGTANVNAISQDGSFKASTSVTVTTPVTGVSFSTTAATISTGSTFQVNAVIVPITATNKVLTYTSSNIATATVSASGLITAVAVGTSTITATTQDGNFSSTFQLNVYSTGLTLAGIFGNNMVLQQNTQAAVWGWGPPNENVQITFDSNAAVTALTDAYGKWTAKITTPIAVKGDNQPLHTLKFVGKNNSTVTLTNILIGDVYLCAGQSNMKFIMQATSSTLGVLDATNEIAAANYPNIRWSLPYNLPQYIPMDNIKSSWSVCTPTTVANFSAVAYYFAKELYNNSNINIPIGLTSVAMSSSSCQSWTSREALAADPVLKANFLDPYDSSPSLSYSTASTVLYNAMIAPLIPFSIKGFLWYQGEANLSASNGAQYYTQLNKAMIKDWRARWGQGDIPFYYVQLPVYQSVTPTFRDQQTNVLTLTNTGMAVSIETGDVVNGHPQDKRTVGKRLSKWAIAKIYGQPITFMGPTFKSMSVEGNKIRIKYHPVTVGSGLAIRWSQTVLNEFQIAGSNGIFYAADATIDGNDVLVSSSSVLLPTKVTFAYNNTAMPNLMNKDSLTACPFSTDTWNNSIGFDSTITEAKVENLSTTEFTIFPIPAKDYLNLQFSDQLNNVRVEIVDITGKIHASYNWGICLQNRVLDISSLSKGFYILHIHNSELNLSRSFVVN